jgi:hypothetical protein
MRLIMAHHRRMMRVGSALLTVFSLLLAPTFVSAQGDDPSEIFLKAYLTAQQGQKLEHENRFKTALAKYRFAGSLIAELRKSHADWQPAIVEYRGRKISEGILQIQERMSRQNDLATGARRLPEIVPSLPETEGAWSEPGPEAVAPQGAERISQGSSDNAAIREATRKLRGKVDQLQDALGKSRADLGTAQKEKELANARLKDAASKSQQAQNEIEKFRKSERQARDQLAKVEGSLKTLEASRDNDAKEQQQLGAEVDRLKDAVAAAEETRLTAEKQRDETSTKFAETSKQITIVKQERDQALAQLKGVTETEQSGKPSGQAILAENSDLKQKLADAEKKIGEIGERKLTNADEFDEVKQQVARLHLQLAESQQRNQYLVARVAELWVQLDETGAQLQNAKLTGKNSEETAQLARENELLRNIVVRERQEEARRYKTKKLMLAELDKLKIKSDTLNKQIEFLTQPVTKLSGEELALLREPVFSISDQKPGVLTASFIFAKESPGDPVEIAKRDATAKSTGGSEATLNNSGGFKEDLPDELQSVAGTAKQNYSPADTQRQKVTSGNPDQKSQ